MGKSKIIRSLTKSNLNSFLRSAGLSAIDADQVSALFMKWIRENGPEWTNSRWKEIRMWYETYLGGHPEPPKWFASTKAGLPKGPIRKIFDLSMTNAILALSINTLLDDPSEPTQAQLDKFEHGLSGNGREASQEDLEILRYEGKSIRCYTGRRVPQALTLPTPSCITASVIPIGNDQKVTVQTPEHPERGVTVEKAYQLSWNGIPDETVEFLWSQDKLDWIPISAIGSEYAIRLDSRKLGKTIGIIGFIPEEQMKLRTVANPNRITQATTTPLGTIWYDVLRGLKTDTTFCKEAGIKWVQDRLREGTVLAGVDMTSASDLLNLEMCLELVNTVFFDHLKGNTYYNDLVSYFTSLSRGQWYCPHLKRNVSWRQGQPLGLFPSFALLALTNNALAMLACKRAGIPIDSFRCHGDDMIIDDRASEEYLRLVQFMGGEINESKTLTSNLVAEFDGMLIRAGDYSNKVIHLKEFSDDSFMAYASYLGPKARKYLKPRQRKVWDELRFIPGIVVEGPWSHDSWGYPLADRLDWWETIKPEKPLDPDPLDPEPVGFILQKVGYSLDLSQKESEMTLPWLIFEEDYQSSEIPRTRKGDPRKWDQNGRSMLQILEGWMGMPGWVPFLRYQKSKCAGNQAVDT